VNPVISQIINKKPLSTRQTYYKINAELDVSKKIVKCEMEAYWVNKSFDFVPDVQMHLYMNAFRSNKTTFNIESGLTGKLKESEIGSIDIKSIEDRNGLDLIPHMQYISPDDGNKDDRTVLKITLPEEAGPGDTVFLNITFETKLPSTIIRTGYKDNYYFVAQWFPKFGVYETPGMRYATSGTWNCHQFHSNSEFYSNHSVYDVNITIPKEYIVGSGGLLLDEKVKSDGTKTLKYRAEDIVDFAWTAWPGYSVFTDNWRDIRITLLLPPERMEQVERQFIAVKNSLEYFSKNVGPYPWPYLTFVDPPSKGEGAGGMEYTTLFTSGSSYKMPGFIHLPEMTTIHEFGHAYFMGILASNEFEEPWLDEGVNSFWEERIADHYYGENSGFINHPWLKISDKSLSRLLYVNSASRQVVSNAEYSWNYPHGTYSMMSYMKTASWLYTFMGITGEETTNEVFREYYRKWAFRYPSGKDFIDVVNDVVKRKNGPNSGTNMDWFFNETLYGTGICDYKVSDFRNERRIIPEGSLKTDDTTESETRHSHLKYKAVVELERTGEVKLPVEVLVHFDNGEEVKESWDGKSRYKDYAYIGNRRIQWVKIDPEFKIRMDVNYINNSMTAKPDHVPVRRLTNKLITLLQILISSVSL
jgi:hypothetical protein